MPLERTEVQVRPGVESDLDALTDIYNHYVRETPITFDTAAEVLDALTDRFGIDLSDLGDRADVEARVNKVLDS